jgi:hypothetical protein
MIRIRRSSHECFGFRDISGNKSNLTLPPSRLCREIAYTKSVKREGIGHSLQIDEVRYF